VRAAVCREFGTPLSVETVALAAVGPGDVHVELAACAVCHSDIHFVQGAWGGQLPAVYGHEAAGTVTAVGPQVSDVAVGDHVVVTLIRSCGECHQCHRGNEVFCTTPFAADESPRLTDDDGPVLAAMNCGAFAEEVVVDRSQVVVVPNDLDWSVASLLACGVITGVGAVTNTSSANAASTVVVVGVGGVGLNTVQGAAIVGAPVIVAVDLAQEKLEVARAFGATHVATPDNVREVIAVATGSAAGVSHVFVTVGSAPAIKAALTYLEPGGELVIVGMPAVGNEIEVDPVDIAASGQRIIGSKMGTSQIQHDIPRLIDWYREGKLKLDELVSGTFSLDEINEAIAGVGDGSVIRNVVLLSGADAGTSAAPDGGTDA